MNDNLLNTLAIASAVLVVLGFYVWDPVVVGLNIFNLGLVWHIKSKYPENGEVDD